MGVNENIVIEGLEDIIKRDLVKYKENLKSFITDVDGFVEARSYHINKKKHYTKLIKKGKYDKESMLKAREQIGKEVRKYSDLIDQTQEKIEIHKIIIDDLTKQLEEQNMGLRRLHEFKRRERKNGP